MSKKKISLKNLAIAEIRWQATIYRFLMLAYAMLLCTLMTVFTPKISDQVFVQISLGTGGIMFIFLSTYNVIYEKNSIDSMRLIFLLFNRKMAVFVRLFFELLFFIIKFFLIFIVLLIVYLKTNTYPINHDYAFIFLSFLKAIISFTTYYAILYCGANFVQTFTRDENVAKGLIFIFLIFALGPLLACSYLMPYNHSFAHFLATNAPWIQAVPYFNFTSVLLFSSDGWYGSFFFLAEALLLFGLLWNKYSHRLKQYYIAAVD